MSLPFVIVCVKLPGAAITGWTKAILISAPSADSPKTLDTEVTK